MKINEKIRVLRDVFDGDGSICMYNNGKYKKTCVSLISANEKYLEDMTNFLIHYEVKFNELKKKGSHYYIRVESKKIVNKFLECFYLNSNKSERLDIKYTKAQEIYSHINTKINIKDMGVIQE